MTQPESTPSWAIDEQMPSGEAAPLRCLLVEDSRFDRSLVRYSAERAGVDIQFTDAASLSEARDSLNRDTFELILLDRGLPDGDGLDLPAELTGNARNSGVPTIMLSGGDEDFLSDASRTAGCVDFLSKHDLSAESLAKVIRAVMESRPSRQHAVVEDAQASEELQSLLVQLDDLAKVARIKPLASRISKLVSDVRQRMGDQMAPEMKADIEELSELALMLWLEVDSAEDSHSRVT